MSLQAVLPDPVLTPWHLDQWVGVHQALSDAARIRLLHLVYHWREMCPSDLEMITEFSQSKTSRHLTHLRKAGLLLAHRKDQYQFFYVPEPLIDWLGQYLSGLAADVVLQKDLETTRILMSNRELVLYKLQNKRYTSGMIVRG